MSWFETDIFQRISGPVSAQLDIQFRTAADQEGQPDRDALNIFKHPFQVVFRPWLHYEIGRRGVRASGLRLSISPLGYWMTWNYFEGDSTFMPEYRTTLQAQYDSRAGKVYLTNRLRYEFRFFGERTPATGGFDVPPGSHDDMFSSDKEKGRIRYMLRTWIPLGRRELVPGTWYVALFDELFIGVGRNVPSDNLFDQNRIYVGIGRKVARDVRVEMGYMNQTVARFNRPPDYNNLEVNHILATAVYLDNVGALFR